LQDIKKGAQKAAIKVKLNNNLKKLTDPLNEEPNFNFLSNPYDDGLIIRSSNTTGLFYFKRQNVFCLIASEINFI